MKIDAYKSGAWGIALALEVFTRSIDVHLLIFNITIILTFKRRGRQCR